MRAAVVQLSSTQDVEHNLGRAAHWIDAAAEAGAELITLPENFSCLREEGDRGPHPAAQPVSGSIVQLLRDRAKQHGVVIAGATFSEEIPGDARTYNTSIAIDPGGEVVSIYRKIHLFDVALAEASLQESRTTAPGDALVVAETAVGALGLSVCYDVRFPELYRGLVERGARILLVPAAFTVPTGRDHWEVLLRARAIENQAFVLAPAQFGVHNSTRRSYGRSLIIDPWGTVLATVPDGEGFALADLDFARQDEIRTRLPALLHRRL